VTPGGAGLVDLETRSVGEATRIIHSLTLRVTISTLRLEKRLNQQAPRAEPLDYLANDAVLFVVDQVPGAAVEVGVGGSSRRACR
jgi:hypothetical protein